MGAELTVRQKILLAAVTLVDDAEAFTVEDLIVRAWEQFPESFALRGYHALHPDSNRVLAKLSGTDGLCGLGWLEHTDQRMYRITRKGRLVSKQLSAIQSGATRDEAVEAAPERPKRVVERPAVKVVAPAVEKPVKAPAARVERPVRARSERAAPRGPISPLTDSEKYALMMIARGDALRKFLRGSPLAFSDACSFWGISSSMRHQLVQSRLDSTAELLKRAVETFGGDGPTDPGVPTLATCYGLFNLDRLMREKFSREVDALRLPVAAGSEG